MKHSIKTIILYSTSIFLLLVVVVFGMWLLGQSDHDETAEQDLAPTAGAPTMMRSAPAMEMVAFNHDASDYASDDGMVMAIDAVEGDQPATLLQDTTPWDIKTQILVALGVLALFSIPLGWLFSWPVRRAMVAQQRFVADISHELKTPLSLMSSELELFRERYKTDTPSAEAVDTLVENLSSDTRRLNRLVGRLLGTLASREHAVGPQEQESFTLDDAHVFLDNFIGRYRASCPTHDFVHHSDALGSGVVWANGQDIIQVVEILVENACLHTPQGTRVEIVEQSDRSWYRIIVADNGPGISSDEAPRVFERLYRAGGHHTGCVGYGLGLSIARKLVVDNGGTIDLKQQPGGGARFVVSLPITTHA